MILTENLSKQFKEVLAVDRVSLEVKAGEVLALLGPNGAGKTTTVRMLTTVLKPTAGRASVAGYDVLAHPGQVRQAVGVLTEDHGLYDRMRMGEYLDFFGQLYNMPSSKRGERISYLVEKFDLQEAAGRRIGKFSKGMRQKLSLARSLLHTPPVLLLDEPTSAMDPASARLVRNAISTLRSEDRAVIVCTHNLAEAEELADTIAIIRSGRIIANGSPADLKRQLLGPGEYRASFEECSPLEAPELPPGAVLTGTGPGWITYQTDHPRRINPDVIRSLMGAGCSVIGLEEIQRSLESVYLQAVNQDPVEDAEYVD